MGNVQFRSLLPLRFTPQYASSKALFIMNTPTNSLSSRREFLKTSALVGGVLAAPAILPGSLFAKENSDTLRVGLIGCGGRGSGAASQALSADKNVMLTALADVFDGQLQNCLK